MKIYFLNELNFVRKDAGFKARKDAVDIISEMGRVQVINIPLWGSLLSRLTNGSKLFHFLLTLNRTDVFLFNFPMPKPFWQVLTLARKLKGFKIVPLIHDIDALRGGHGKDPIRILSCDKIISHNKNMSLYLKNKSSKKIDISEIHAFDYYLPYESAPRLINDQQREVIFAGNLDRAKCGFIYTLEDVDNIKLFGVNYAGGSQNYMGSFDSQFPDAIRQPGIVFGLIWDGDSIETCSGSFGEYLKFNNPHKTSLYLSMGLPVLIWKEAAIASFIIDNNLGFGVSNIKEAMNIVNTISLEQYQLINSNVEIISKKIRQGYYLSKVVDEVIDDFSIH